MRLYLDTANTQDWVKLLPLGVFYGITTNPLLAQRAGLDYARSDWRGLLAHAKALGAQELHLQAFGDPSTYLKWAREIYDIAHQEEITAVIKIPLVRPAIAQVPDLKALGGKILMTACYDAVQCLTAIALEADYLAPYLRIDIETNGCEVFPEWEGWGAEGGWAVFVGRTGRGG
mgnify:CR=1 FL=1